MTTSVRTFFLVLLFGLAARGEPGRVSHAVTQRPFYFEANEGRYEPAVRFVARTPGGSVFVMDDGMVLDVFGSTPIRVRFPRSGGKVVVEGVDPLPTRTHHFIGSDPSGWKRNLAVFSRVRVSRLHPGIHVEHYRGPNGLEHDYIVDPGADPGRIRFTIEGGDRTGLAANGDLLVHAGDDVVRFHKPTISQQAGPDRDLVEGEYVRAGPAEFGFHIENYDASRPLIIDPVLSAPTVFGGSDAERLNAVDVDNAGNIYVTGSTRSADFPTRNPLFPNAAGETDVFIVKFDPTAQNMIWATFLGGSAFDSGQGLAVGPGGGVHVVGNTSSADFPLRDAMQQDHGGGSDGFVAKLNTDGDVLEWSTFLGGAGSDSARAVEIDLAGNILIGGETSSADFPATAGALSETLGGGQDCFVSKLASSGQGLIFSTFLGGGGRDSCSAIALTKDGEVAIVGASDSTDFPTTAGAFQPALNPKPSPRFPTIDFADAVAAVLNADGTDLVYGSYFGGADDDFASAVAIDPTGKVWLGGGTSSADFPVTPDADQSTPLGDSNAWIARLDPGSAAAALRSDRLGRREQGTAAFYLSLMPAARLGALAIITAAAGIGDSQLLAALVNFFPNSERESILVLLTATGGQSLAFPPVEGGVNAVTASERGAVVVAATNGQNSDAMLSTITVEQTEGGANLDISKTADPEKVATGAEVLYTIKVFNRGPEEAENVVVIDTLESNSAVIGDLPDKCIGNGPQVRCDLGTVPVGGVGVSRVFEVRAPAEPGTMVNTALVSTSNAEPTSPAVVDTVVEAGTDVKIELTGPGAVLSDRPVGFKITVTNRGPLVATDVKVVFPIDPAMELEDPFYSSAKGACERKGGKSPLPFLPDERTEVQCELAEMAVREEWIINVNGRAGLLGTTAGNKAEVGIREADTEPSNNYGSRSVDISGNPAADVDVRPRSLSDPLSVGPGGSNHVVSVYVENNGLGLRPTFS